MNTAWAAALSRVHDGEAVDADVVADALESDEMRSLFVDFVRLRSQLSADRFEPSPAFYTRMGRTLRPPRPFERRRTALRLAAALIVTALLAALGVESWQRWREGRPPQPSRVLRFEASEWKTSGVSGS
jgi:hypothetical protein